MQPGSLYLNHEQPMRILLAGVGRWGEVHARCVARTPGAVVAAVLDQDTERAASIAGSLGCPVLGQLDDLSADVDAAIVTVSSSAHLQVTRELLHQNIPVLLEKPLVTSNEELDELLELAAGPTLLWPALIERYNPAFVAATAGLGTTLFVQTERLAPFTARSLETDVLLDLMIHDLDLVLGIMDGPVSERRAVGAPVLSEQADMAHVRLEFEGGGVAVLVSSRVSPAPSRSMRIFGTQTYHSINLIQRQAHSCRRVAGKAPHIEADAVQVPEGDALAHMQGDFFDRVRGLHARDGGLERAAASLRLVFDLSQEISQGLDRWRTS